VHQWHASIRDDLSGVLCIFFAEKIRDRPPIEQCVVLHLMRQRFDCREADRPVKFGHGGLPPFHSRSARKRADATPPLITAGHFFFGRRPDFDPMALACRLTGQFLLPSRFPDSKKLGSKRVGIR
jgi:hypothetical protein